MIYLINVFILIKTMNSHFMVKSNKHASLFFVFNNNVISLQRKTIKEKIQVIVNEKNILGLEHPKMIQYFLS